jgi:hypothetical protein
MSNNNDLRVDSRGLLISVGDLCLVIHKNEDDDILMTTGFYEGEKDPPKRDDFQICPIGTLTLGQSSRFKGSYVFRLHSFFEEYQLHRFTLLSEGAINSYRKHKRIINGKRFITALTELVELPDVPFDPIASIEFEEGLEDEETD